MTWEMWMQSYLGTHCVARGLRPKTIAAYQATLQAVRDFVRFRLGDRGPDQLSAKDLLAYVEYLRRERDNGPSAVNRQVTILRSFYRAAVAMDLLAPDDNPMAKFPKMKAAPSKLPVFLSEKEVEALIEQPRQTTVMGLRDRAILTLLYGTGIRASECAAMHEEDADLVNATIRVEGKGGRERVIPLNDAVLVALTRYREARGAALPKASFFRSRGGRDISRSTVYERVRKHSQAARIKKRVSPHRLRHTFATHLVKRGVRLVTIRDLLGHRCISSTQIYLHTTAADLRDAANKHPIEGLVRFVEELLPNVKLPFQWHPGEKVFGTG